MKFATNISYENPNGEAILMADVENLSQNIFSYHKEFLTSWWDPLTRPSAAVFSYCGV